MGPRQTKGIALHLSPILEIRDGVEAESLGFGDHFSQARRGQVICQKHFLMRLQSNSFTFGEPISFCPPICLPSG